jgi:hypothetical protein
LQNTKFIAWLEREGYDRDAVTPQMVDEFDELQMEESRKRRAKSTPPPPPIVEEVDAAKMDQDEWDPSKMDQDEWNAGANEWMREVGHDDLTMIPAALTTLTRYTRARGADGP